MMRWDIINHLLKKTGGDRYLEIGYYKGWSFDNVNAKIKTAVDPNPSKDSHMEGMPYGMSMILDNSRNGPREDDNQHWIQKQTSNDFFSSLDSNIKYNVIFIDGLHEGKQVAEDIENALKHLETGGYIVLHDMNPPTFAHTTTGVDGCWTGDCYKAILDLMPEPINYVTVDTDWGVGIFQPLFLDNIKPSYVSGLGQGKLDFNKAKEDWDYFSENRKELMNIISVEEFKTKY